MKSLTIVVPAYNEEAAIASGRLASVKQWAGQQPFAVEVLVVDDGSKDKTAELAGQIADRVIAAKHLGKAHAIITGIRSASSAVVLVTDMDQATPITEADKLLDAIERSADIAIGSRGARRAGAPLRRYVLSWGHSMLRRLLLGMAIADTQCGFKGFRRQAALEIINNLQLYRPERIRMIDSPNVSSGFDTEFLFVAKRLAYDVVEVPVEWVHRQSQRVHTIRDAWRGTRDLVLISLSANRGKYPRARH